MAVGVVVEEVGVYFVAGFTPGVVDTDLLVSDSFHGADATAPHLQLLFCRYNFLEIIC